MESWEKNAFLELFSVLQWDKFGDPRATLGIEVGRYNSPTVYVTNTLKRVRNIGGGFGLKKGWDPCKIWLSQPISKEPIHGYYCSETAGCQEKQSEQAKRMSVLPRGDISTLGAGEETGAGYAGAEYLGLPVSLLLVWEDLSILSRSNHAGRSDRAVATVSGDVLEIGVELSQCEHHLE